MNFVHLTFGKFTHQFAKIYPPGHCRIREHPYLCASCFQSCSAGRILGRRRNEYLTALRRQEFSCGRRFHARINYDAQRLTLLIRKPHIHLRIIGQNRSNTGQYCAGSTAPKLHIGTSRFTGNPLRASVWKCCTAVERHSCFHSYPRRPPRHPR